MEKISTCFIDTAIMVLYEQLV